MKQFKSLLSARKHLVSLVALKTYEAAFAFGVHPKKALVLAGGAAFVMHNIPRTILSGIVYASGGFVAATLVDLSVTAAETAAAKIYGVGEVLPTDTARALRRTADAQSDAIRQASVFDATKGYEDIRVYEEDV